MEITKVRTVKEAHGGLCETCQMAFNISTCPYWHWSKSVAMHRDGTGHKVELYRIA